MRNIHNFSYQEWLKGHPLRDGFKQLRNDLMLKQFLRQSQGVDGDDISSFDVNSSLIISIAFNKPQIISLLIKKFQINVSGATLLIADNSSDIDKRIKIKQTCQHHQIPYIPLPVNRTQHPNRSHGMAMQWCYQHIVNKLKPNIFGFIDHDLIPLQPVNMASRINTQPFYGVQWFSEKTSAWQLWAGYCFFHYPTATHYPLNFLYDFSNGLDTGGRNYQALYQHFNAKDYTFAADQMLEKASNHTINKIHRIDNKWLHLGGAGHRLNFDKEFNSIVEKLDFLEQSGLSNLEQLGYTCTTRHRQ